MNRGLLEKSFREIWPATLGFGLLLLAVEGVVSFVLPAFRTELRSVILEMGFVRTLLSALLGTRITESMGTNMLQAVPWVHPLVLLTVFGHEIATCTRFPAGEIDRGTIDVLLGLPVSRRRIYISYSALWAVSGALLILFGLAGNWAGTRLAGGRMPDPSALWTILLNAWCLYLAIGCLTLWVSSSSNRRGRAIGGVIALVVASFLINFLGEFWAPAEHMSFASLLSYYRPFLILENKGFPFGDIAVLLPLAAVFWTAGMVTFEHRDIRTL